ncbi:MAG: MBL fold metallo-hydrolase [Thermoplasmatales archaeon]|nr:MBL fold metallo-hydrolase [Thermoplasmatales archaeon]
MNKIKFLGTAGGRFVVARQVRKSGGIWLSLDDTNVLIDPGPGSLIRILSSKPKLNPRDLDGIILSHRHLDHSNDVNIIIEAMTKGGRDKKGVLFTPKDTLKGDPVVLKYIRNYLGKIEIIKENESYKIGNISFETPIKHIHHGVEGYGFNIFGKNTSISIITDTKYFNGLESYYSGDLLILNVVFLENKRDLEHFDIKDAEKIISANKPKLTVLSHFGMTMVNAKPWKIAEKLSNKLGVKIIAASDGMDIDLDHYTK